MKTTFRQVKLSAGYSDTWLAPWVGFIFEIREYKSGVKKWIDGDRETKINGYMEYFSKPLKK